MKTHPQPAMSRRPRPLALPWVWLCLVAYLASAAHFALVRHATCLEHGEWVHEEGVSQGQTSVSKRVSFADTRVTGAEAAAPAHGVDEHCAHAFLRRQLPPSEGVSFSLPAPAPEGPAGVMAREFVSPPVAWLRLAPKASPPSRV